MEAESLVNGVMLGRAIAVLALVVGLILLISWFLRRNGFGTGFQRSNGKSKRLAILETRPIDNQRRLVLIERDSSQHLLLIGGQNDIVIETNIQHDQSATASFHRNEDNFVSDDPFGRVRFRDTLNEATQEKAPPLSSGHRIEPTEEDVS